MEPTELEKRLSTIETRLARLEGSPKAAPKTQAAKGYVSVLAPPIANAPPKENDTAAAVEAKPGNWLGIIAIICFVLAASFIIKLSIDSGWLTPLRQAGLAALLGFSLIGSGLLLMRSDREYASYLPGGGIVILYLTVFAANRYYSLISFEAALGLAAMVSGLCIGLYGRIQHDVYPITAAVGSYLAPVILGFNVEAVFSVYYFLICSVAFTVISIWMRTRILTLVSSYLALALTAMAGFELHMDALIAGMLGLHFLVFAFGTYLYTHTNEKPLTQEEAWGFLPVLLVFYAAEYFFIDRLHPGLAPWVSLGFAGVLVGLYMAAKSMLQGGAQTSRPVVLAYAAIVAFHSIYLELLPEDVRPWLFVAIMVVFAFASHKLGAPTVTSSIFIPAVTLLIIAVIEYISIAYHLLEHYSFSWLAVSFAALASIWGVLVIGNQAYLKRDNAGHALLAAAHALAILALYRLTTDQGSLAVSASWLFYAVGVMVFAVTRKDEVMAKSALTVLGFAAAKALLYDAASAPTVVRIFCLLLTGAVLYGCGLFMRKTAHWKDGGAS